MSVIEEFNDDLEDRAKAIVSRKTHEKDPEIEGYVVMISRWLKAYQAQKQIMRELRTNLGEGIRNFNRRTESIRKAKEHDLIMIKAKRVADEYKDAGLPLPKGFRLNKPLNELKEYIGDEQSE